LHGLGWKEQSDGGQDLPLKVSEAGVRGDSKTVARGCGDVALFASDVAMTHHHLILDIDNDECKALGSIENNEAEDYI
jgi:hypothetical protein